MYHKPVFLLTIFALLALLIGCAGEAAFDQLVEGSTATAPPRTPAGPLQLAVVHTNDTWGYFWPCG
jgi:2',3'-cyclic-nucleotide 2'-phosphodiesterase (5'-nucleotidase family)